LLIYIKIVLDLYINTETSRNKRVEAWQAEKAKQSVSCELVICQLSMSMSQNRNGNQILSYEDAVKKLTTEAEK